MKFAYVRYEVRATPPETGHQVIYRPVIPFRLIGHTDAAWFWGLLDSGADETFITREMAEELGIQPVSEASYRMESASGELFATYGLATFELSHGTETHRWQAPVGIVPQSWTEAILGHRGFLEYFDATFLGNRKELSLVRNELRLPQPATH